MKNWLIIYDIRNGRRLQKVMKVISEYAVRVQKSVYELEADDTEIKRIKSRVAKIIDENCDFVVYFDICSDDWQKREKFGIISEMKPQESFNLL